MRRSSRCELCGAPLSFREFIASRYACLTTCLPLVKSRHLLSAHCEYLEESKRAGRPLLYSALTITGLATILAIAGQPLYITLPLFSSPAVLISIGSYIRLRLISMHKRQEGS